MGIFDDSFSIELNSPIDEESWKVIEDAELDNTEHIYFTTPSGKRVDFIKADVIDEIRAEIKQLADKQFQIAMGVSDLNERYAHIQMENAYRQSLNIIDKYKGNDTESDNNDIQS